MQRTSINRREYCPLHMSANNWTIGGVTIPNFFITRASFIVVGKWDVIKIDPHFEGINRNLATMGLLPIMHTRQIKYHRVRDNTIMNIQLWTNANDSFGWMRHEGRVPGDIKFYYLFDGKKHYTDSIGDPRNHRLFDTRDEFIPYLLHEWYAKQQLLYRDLEERHHTRDTGTLSRISHEVLKNHIMPYLKE